MFSELHSAIQGMQLQVYAEQRCPRPGCDTSQTQIRSGADEDYYISACRQRQRRRDGASSYVPCKIFLVYTSVKIAIGSFEIR